MKNVLSKWLGRIKRLPRFLGIRSKSNKSLPVVVPPSYAERFVEYSGPYHFVLHSFPSRKTDTRPSYEVNLILKDCGPPQIFKYVIDVIKAS